MPLSKKVVGKGALLWPCLLGLMASGMLVIHLDAESQIRHKEQWLCCTNLNVLIWTALRVSSSLHLRFGLTGGNS